MRLRVPAAAAAIWLSACAFAHAQVAAPRPAPYVPASRAWGFVLRHWFESDFGKAAPVSPLLAALRPLDLVEPGPRLLAAPLVGELAQALPSAGAFATLTPERRLELLEAAAARARKDAAERAADILAEGLPDRDLPGAVPLSEQLAGPLSLYLPEATAAAVAKAAPALGARLEAARERLVDSAEKTAEALGKTPEPEPPYLRARRAASPEEAARLARDFAWGLRSTTDLEAKRGYVNALWEFAERRPSKDSHRTAASALIRELNPRRRASEKHRLLVLQALRALADHTPYESVERRVVAAALDLAGRFGGDRVTREAAFVAEAVAMTSPFASVRKLVLKACRERLSWTGDEGRKPDLERRIADLERPVPRDYWPSWKPPKPPTFLERLWSLLTASRR